MIASKNKLLTEYQYAVMGILAKEEHSGRGLRLSLAKVKIPIQGPTFYQLMQRMERNKLLKSRTLRTEDVERVALATWRNESFYRATAKGLKTAAATREFFTNFSFPAKIQK